ncbi:MAG: hypothetical protein CL908_07540 [Deltaproteobacteria bacterium]|jgi:predicted TIM-barrel fold metal-dependent hydrolase|nr:hypothetical protein [Deltaproteobacteria bacterium]
MSEAEMIDCHTHVVAADREAYPLDPRALSASQWYLDCPQSAEQLRDAMDPAGVARAILVQGVGAYSYDNRYIADMGRKYPTRFVSACCIDVEADSALEQVDHWIGSQGVQGIRLFALSREGSSWLADERTFPIWERATKLGAHVIITILSGQIPELRAVLTRFPDIPVSLDHCAFALAEQAAHPRLLELAVFPNLHLKVTTHNLDDATQKDGSARPLVGELVDLFGADRLMWGSDFCQTHDRSYAQLVALARDAFGGLTEADREWCLGGTARKLWPGLRPGG